MARGRHDFDARDAFTKVVAAVKECLKEISVYDAKRRASSCYSSLISEAILLRGVDGPPIDMELVPVMPVLSGVPDGFLVVRTYGESLTVRDIYPGSYRVQFLTDSPDPYFLDSIRLGEQDGLGTFSVVSAALPLTIRFRLGGGTVRGTLDGCGSHHVFLVSHEPALRRDGFIRITGCGRNGHFEFAAVRPGEYYGIAMAKEPRSFADLSDDHVLSQGSKVSVRANESRSADLRLIEH